MTPANFIPLPYRLESCGAHNLKFQRLQSSRSQRRRPQLRRKKICQLGQRQVEIDRSRVSVTGNLRREAFSFGDALAEEVGWRTICRGPADLPRISYGAAPESEATIDAPDSPWLDDMNLTSRSGDWCMRRTFWTSTSTYLATAAFSQVSRPDSVLTSCTRYPCFAFSRPFRHCSSLDPCTTTV